MSDRSDVLDDLVRGLGRVRDEDLVAMATAPGASALLDDILSTPYAQGDGAPPWTPELRNVGSGRQWGRAHRRGVVQVVLAAGLTLAVVVSVPAFGVVQHVKSWLSDLKGPDEPVATGSDVVIASGADGESWKIVATQSDQGLCLFLLTQQSGESAGLGGCGWASDIRGYWSDAGGDLHWIAGGNGSGGVAALNRIVTYGVAAQDVAGVELELANGETVPARLVELPEGIDAPLNFYWAVLGPDEGVELSQDGGVVEPLWPLVHALVARDSAGLILESRIVDQPHG